MPSRIWLRPVRQARQPRSNNYSETGGYPHRVAARFVSEKGCSQCSRNAFAQIGGGFKSMFGGELAGMTKNLAGSRGAGG